MKLKSLRPFVPSGEDYALSKSFFLEIGFVENWGDDGLCELQMNDVKFLLQNFKNIEMQQNLMMSRLGKLFGELGISRKINFYKSAF